VYSICKPFKNNLLFAACTTRETINRPVDWRFPISASEKLRYTVFRDLWEQGHFLTSGLKFGGDFLAYPGWDFIFKIFNKAQTK